MTAPKRIQQRRTAGWRKPEGAVAVGRQTRWGNPFRIGDRARVWHLAVTPDEVRAELAGKDLACWCPLDQPCHADVLLSIANTPEGLPS